MTGNPAMVIEHFNDRVGYPQLDLFANQSMRHRVIVALEFDVVIETRDAGALELGVLEWHRRQRSQGRTLEQLEPRAPAPFQFLNGRLFKSSSSSPIAALSSARP